MIALQLHMGRLRVRKSSFATTSKTTPCCPTCAWFRSADGSTDGSSCRPKIWTYWQFATRRPDHRAHLPSRGGLLCQGCADPDAI